MLRLVSIADPYIILCSQSHRDVLQILDIHFLSVIPGCSSNTLHRNPHNNMEGRNDNY